MENQSICKRYECMAYTKRQTNKCSALTEVYFFTKSGAIRECPFYKEKDTWVMEVLRLRAGGHMIDDRGLYKALCTSKSEDFDVKSINISMEDK